jgi:hypothetical protein
MATNPEGHPDCSIILLPTKAKVQTDIGYRRFEFRALL